MNWFRMTWLRMIGRYNAERSASMQRHPSGKKLGQ